MTIINTDMGYNSNIFTGIMFVVLETGLIWKEECSRNTAKNIILRNDLSLKELCNILGKLFI